MSDVIGRVFNIQHFSTEDGPGIRTTVFLKGCPLRCPWCANPESQAPFPQLGHRAAKCIKCGTCIRSCPAGALHVADGQVRIRRELCRSCGTCVRLCPSGAMFFYGEEKTVEQVFDEVSRDAGYYEQSGGGVTVSGGECMTQPQFVSDLFRRCKEAGFHTALDTCGYFDEQALYSVWDYVDLVLFDLKLMDSQRHRQYTGVDNVIIQDNLKRMLAKGMNVVIRVPVIPGINDREGDLEAIADFVFKLDSSLHVDLLPYHRYGLGKYRILDMEYQLNDINPPDDAAKLAYEQIFRAYGLSCTVH